MSVDSALVTVAGTPTRLSAVDPQGDHITGHSISVQNPAGNESVALGGPDVTFAQAKLRATGIYQADLGPGDELYAISDGTAVVVEVIWTGI